MEKNSLYFTFWPKEGSIAWFVAVRSSIMLLERQKSTMKLNSGTWNTWWHIKKNALKKWCDDKFFMTSYILVWTRPCCVQEPRPLFFFSISPSAVSRKRDFVDELGATLQCYRQLWLMTVCHSRGREKPPWDIDGLLLMHAAFVLSPCWEQGLRATGGPLVRSSMPIREKNQANARGITPDPGW